MPKADAGREHDTRFLREAIGDRLRWQVEMVAEQAEQAAARLDPGEEVADARR